MAAMTDFFENKLIDWLFRGQAIGITGATAAAGSGPANLYLGLLTATPTDSTAGTEVSATGTGYARVTLASNATTWGATQGTPGTANTTATSSGTGGATYNNAAITWPTAPTAAWGTITGFGIYDAATGGNLLIYSGFTGGVTKTVNSGDPAPSFVAGALTFQIDN